MSEEFYDYPETAPDVLAVGKFNELNEAVQRQAEAELAVKQAGVYLDRAKSVLRELSEEIVPAIMDEIGLTEVTTSSGIKVKVAENIRAAIPADKKHQAFGWLRDHDYEALIKRKIIVEFGKGEDEKADELSQKLAEDYDIQDDSSVHTNTLSSWVKKKLEEGEELPMDLLGVFRQRVSKIATK